VRYFVDFLGQAYVARDHGHSHGRFHTNNADEYGVTDSFTTITDDYIAYVEGLTGNLNATFLAVYPADNDTQASTSQIALVRDQSTVSSWQAMNGFSNSSDATTYTYYWNYAPPNDGSTSHGSEIPYALDNLWAQTGVNLAASRTMRSQTVCKLRGVLSSP
jgi:carboxylesterase 2